MFDEETIKSIVSNMFVQAIAKKKLEKGEELTEEEKDALLQKIYISTIESLRNYKKAASTKTKIGFKVASIVSGLAGEKFEGYHSAMTAAGTGLKENIDNCKRVLKGIALTATNQTSQNFTTLIEQYEQSKVYSQSLFGLITGIQEVNDSYKKDFQSPIAIEEQEELRESRSKILDLSNQYEKTKKMK